MKTRSNRIIPFLCFFFAVLVLVPAGKVRAGSDIPDEIKDNGIPIVSVTTDPDDFAKVLESEDHSAKAKGTITIDVPDNYKGDYSDVVLEDMEDLKLSYIRGRGNSTWTLPKKPFKIKLKDAENLLGMGSSKHWVLLANYLDGSSMKNRLVSYIGSRLGMEFTPRMLPVDLVVNGKYMGTYMLGEHIRVEKNRVNIDELTPSDTGDPEITGGYLLAMAPYPTEPEGNTFETARGIRFQGENPVFESDDPDDELGAPEQKTYISDYIQNLEDAIYNKGMKDAKGNHYSKYMDLKSAADYWWIQEVTINADAFITPSTYLFKKRNGKLFWGPLWDFDQTCFPGYDGDSFGVADMPWLDYMRAYDPKYQKTLKEEWKKLSAVIDEIVRPGGVLDRYKEETEKSWEDNKDVWGSDEDDRSLEDQVEILRDFFTQRSSWINDHIDEVTKVYINVTFKVDGKVISTVTVHRNRGLNPDDIPEDPKKDGYLFTGWYDQKGNKVTNGYASKEDVTAKAVFVRKEDATTAEDVFFELDDVWVANDSESYDSHYLLSPENPQDSTVDWEVSDPDTASVDSRGTVLFKEGAGGELTVTATVPSGKAESYTIHFYDPDKVDPPEPSSVTPEKETLTVKVGELAHMKLTLAPSPCSPVLTYESSDEDVAKLLDYGVVEGVKPGTCTIKITDMMGDAEATYTVTVTK